ncbi:MAG: Gfo/Idh/MocA family oxidoreductase [Sphaerochaetaceae bacterium]|nr:Gfo/Idh/MocA family oxidoreductase [Sphaerochaetaceae bacterium]
METMRWGILGTAKIARTSIIPALRRTEHCELAAVASRDMDRAAAIAGEFEIPRAYGSYEELLDDPDIDIVYLPLPNHLHVEWIEKAALAGKHVLCEKPLALDSSDVQRLIALRERTGKLIGEAYVVLHQPRLRNLRELLESGGIGRLQSVDGCFFLDNRDPENIRNKYQEGGGGLWDIGVYPIVCGRWMFGCEPVRVACTLTMDEVFAVDRLASGVMEFPGGGQLTFSCGTQNPRHTCLTLFTDTHRIEVLSPFSTDPALKSDFELYDDNVLSSTRIYSFLPSDQYALECDHFVESIETGAAYAGSLEHSLENTRVMEALFRSARNGRWEEV